jgi:poly(3-hydroxybutyrate) depolymerase
MLYNGYQAWSDAAVPFRIAAKTALKLRDWAGPYGDSPLPRSGFAFLDVASGARVTHHRPPFGIDRVTVGNREVEVREEVALALPFCNLIHFAKDEVETLQPRMLVVAPLSGHFATLLRGTVKTLLRDHDVYITDWVNARDVPLADGPFGFDDYITYVIRCLETLGPNSHVLAVCQPCVQTLAAVAVMAEDKNPAQPRTMTLMGGPVDTRAAPTKVNELAMSKPFDWFEKNLVSRVPIQHAGRGRKVYPGFLQLTAFMSMNLERHVSQHQRMYALISEGKTAEAAVIRDFYEEYFAVLDLPAEFYLETVDRVFQRDLLAAGTLIYRNRIVRPAAIQRTALLTVEGERRHLRGRPDRRRPRPVLEPAPAPEAAPPAARGRPLRPVLGLEVGQADLSPGEEPGAGDELARDRVLARRRQPRPQGAGDRPRIIDVGRLGRLPPAGEDFEGGDIGPLPAEAGRAADAHRAAAAVA